MEGEGKRDLERLALEIVRGHVLPVTDLRPDELTELAEIVAERRRERFMQFLADIIALDIVRDNSAK
jgi:hypothetical protein